MSYSNNYKVTASTATLCKTMYTTYKQFITLDLLDLKLNANCA